MIVTLESPELTVAIEDAGAQLASIRDRRGTEYLWQGDPAVWVRRAPLLFPIIARLKDGCYTLGNETWHIPTHGFCRAAPFAVTEQTKTRASFRYTDTEETRQVYPFSFVLTVTYTLEGNRLRKAHRVENRSGEPMLYELGGHDGYRVPLEAGETMSDYAVRVPGLEAITPYTTSPEKLVAPKGPSYALPGGRIPVKPSVYGLDTIILDELPERRAVLVDAADRPRVTVEFPDFPYLGIWTADKAFDTNYVCLEPWTTLPDATFVGRGLADKPGIRVLEPGACETLVYTAAFT